MRLIKVSTCLLTASLLLTSIPLYADETESAESLFPEHTQAFQELNETQDNYEAPESSEDMDSALPDSVDPVEGLFADDEFTVVEENDAFLETEPELELLSASGDDEEIIEGEEEEGEDDFDDLEELVIGENTLTFSAEKRWNAFKLTLEGNDQDMVRYRLYTDNEALEITWECGEEGERGLGFVSINGSPGNVCRIGIVATCKTDSIPSTAALTVEKMPAVAEIQQENENAPVMVANYEGDATNKVMVRFKYRDDTPEDDTDNVPDEDMPITQFYWVSDGAFCSSDTLDQNGDLDRANLISDLANYSGTAYLKIYLVDPTLSTYYEEIETMQTSDWSFIAQFEVKPYNSDDYVQINSDNTEYTVEKNKDGWFRFIPAESGMYEFIGFHAAAGTELGGYDAEACIGIGRAEMEAGQEYFIVAKVRGDIYDNVPDSGYFICHRKAILKNVEIEADEGVRLTWANWNDHIHRVITYEDPESHEEYTFRAPITDNLANHRNYYFDMSRAVSNVGPNQWKLSLFDYDDIWNLNDGSGDGEDGDEAGGEWESDDSLCSEVFNIYNVDISQDVNSSVGEDTNEKIEESLKYVIEDSDNGISEETSSNIEKAEGKHISANFEINPGTDEDLEAIEDQIDASSEKVDQIIDAQIVIRADAKILGTIDEAKNELDLSIKTSDYDPNKQYSIIRLHNGAAEKLDCRVEQVGNEASFWFKSAKFSAFALVENESPEEDPAPAPDTVAPQTADAVQQTIVPSIAKKPVLKKAKAGNKGKVTVSWKHFKLTKKTKAIWEKAAKVEIQYSTDRDFKTDVKSKLVGKKKKKCTISKLKKNTTYYVRIRYTNGPSVFSDWSKVKKVKTKKK